MNVRFFNGTKAEYLGLANHNPIALYFCRDTRELFWGDKLISDGMRVVSTTADLPAFSEAADGIVYYVMSTRNGYVLSPNRLEWLQVIYAPNGTSQAALSNYYTKAEVDEAIAKIELPDVSGFLTEVPEEYVTESELKAKGYASKVFVLEKILEAQQNSHNCEHSPAIDLSDYVTKDEIKDFITEIPAKYVTEKELKIALDAIEYPTTDLTGYATKEFVEDSIANIAVDHTEYVKREELDGFIKNIPDEYITESELADEGYITEQSLEAYAKKDDIPSVEGLADKEYVNSEIAKVATDIAGKADVEHAHSINDISDYVAPDLSGYVTRSELPDFNEFAAAADVANKADREHRHDDLYDAKGAAQTVKDELLNGAGDAFDTLKELNDLIVNNKDAIEALETIAVGKADKEHTHDQYLTEHQSLEGYALESYVDTAIASIEIPDISGFITEIPEEYITADELAAEGFIKEHQSLEGYATESFVKNAIAEAELNEKDVDLTGYATKDELSAVEAKIPTIDGLATEEYVDNAISNIEIPEAEIYKVDFNAPDFAAALEAYNNGKLLLLVNAAPDANGYAVMNYVRADLITFTKFLTSRSEAYGSFNTYYLHSNNTWELSKEVQLNKVEANTEGEINGELTSIRIGKEIYSIPNTDGLASTEYVDNAINNLEVPEVDLEGYATETYVQEEIAKITIPDVSDFITEEEVDAKGFLTEHQDLSEYAKKSDIPDNEVFVVDFATPDFTAALEAYKAGKLLLLTNAAPDAAGYAVMNYVRDDMITFTKFLMSRSETYGSFNTYYLHSDNTWEVSKEVKLNKVEANVDDEVIGELTSIRIGKEVYGIPNTDGFASTEYVDNAINNIEIPEVDLTGLATEEFVKNAIAEAQFEDKEVDLSGLATKEELGQVEAKIPSVDGLASEQYVNEQLATIKVPTKVSELENDAGYLVSHQDLSEYAKKSDIPTDYLTAIPDEYITESELAAELTKIEHPTVSLDGYATEAWVNEQGFIKEIPDTYAKKEELFSGSYNDLTDKPEIPSVDGLATTEYVDSAIASIEIPEPEKVDLTGYAKLTDIPDVSKFIEEVPAEYITEEELSAKGYLTEHQDLSEYAKKSDLFNKDYNELVNTPEIPSLDGYATEQYVNDAIDNLNIPEADLTGYATEEFVAGEIAGAVAVKADEVPFTTSKFVKNAVGSFVVGEDISGLTIAELFAKLLELSDESTDPSEPDVPEVPEEPDSPVEVAKKLAMYSVTTNNELVASSDASVTTMTVAESEMAPTKSGFYQIVDENGEVIESGYQDLTITSEDTYYIIALPKVIDYNTMIKMQAYDADDAKWYDADKLPLISDPDTVAALCDEVGVDISHIDTNVYTVWVLEDICTGSQLRYIIKEA